MKTNCPNCGAVIDPQDNKCKYCGTSYFDLTNIDFDNRVPVYLKIKANGWVITQRVIPEIGSIETRCDYDTISIYDRGSIRLRHDTTTTTNIEFTSLGDPIIIEEYKDA